MRRTFVALVDADALARLVARDGITPVVERLARGEGERRPTAFTLGLDGAKRMPRSACGLGLRPFRPV